MDRGREPKINQRYHRPDRWDTGRVEQGKYENDIEETRYFERVLFGEYHVRVRPTDIVLQHTAYDRKGKQADAIMEVRWLVKELRDKHGCTEMEITRALQCAFDEKVG